MPLPSTPQRSESFRSTRPRSMSTIARRTSPSAFGCQILRSMLVVVTFQRHACLYWMHTTRSVRFGNLLSVCERLSNQDYSALPPRLQPTTSLPHGSTVSYIIHHLQDGTMDVLRIIRFAAKVAAKEATGSCTGLPLFFAYREGPWSGKKAVHALLGRLPGHHVVWWTLCQKELKRSQSTAWTAPDDELVKGVDFVNKNAPDDDSENQQYLWILTNIKPDSGSPIGRRAESSGWLRTKVVRM